MNNISLVFSLFLVPAVAGAIVLIIPKKFRGAKEAFSLLLTAFILCVAVCLFKLPEIKISMPWVGYGLDFQLRLYHFSQFILLAVAGFSFLITLFSVSFMSKKENTNQFYSYLLITLGMVNGAVLADNLVVLLFFWEGLLLTLFGMIAIGKKDAWKSAVKALIITGVTDLCMMLGIGIVYFITGTVTMSQLSIPLTGASSVAFILIMIGAISKAGAMPFHSWIPDAAIDAPLPFMAFLPASLEKLLGIYLLARISLNIFQLVPSHWLTVLLMIIGAITILFAVMMALIQKDYKRLLSYHAISQVGYMIMGIGTGLPAGIVGGLFHMINHAMYKSCLFLTGGSVEKQAGTTDLEKLGGIGRLMPITFTCFIIAAAAISGVPPLNGFFSKELVYDGALERHWIFYAAALAGSFFTAASFLKLGHSAFLGKLSDENKKVKEAPVAMLIPMIVIAAFCILFGLYNSLPLKNLIQPILGVRLEGHNFSGLPSNVWLIVGTCLVLLVAYLNHMYGVKKTGKGIGAADHIHYAPGLAQIYDKAEKRFFDPYDIGLKVTGVFANTAFYIDRGIDWLYNGLSVSAAYSFSRGFRKANTGSYSSYIMWSLVGIFCIFIFSLF